MADFYVDTLTALLRRGIVDRSMRLLVVCGGEDDAKSLHRCGFDNVVISNIDRRFDATRCAPYAWAWQDAERLAYSDDEFDVCMVHSGLHHCQSPHRALGEMYRVARVAVLAFEPFDNLATRFGVKLGLGEEYEIASVAGQGGEFGGLRNSAVPNHVYRWTEREVEKTIKSYSPLGRHTFFYFYQTRLNWMRARTIRQPWLRWVFRVVAPLAALATRVFPRASNNFAACVVKPRLPSQRLPWLQIVNGQASLDEAWIAERFNSMSHSGS